MIPKILVVDDDPVTAMDLESNLRSLGYDVTGMAGTAEQAMDILQRELPDLVLMDIQLSGNFEGIRAASEIRRKCQVPVIFVSGYMSQDLLNRAKASSVLGYLTKPVRTQDLHAAITLALAQQSTPPENGKARASTAISSASDSTAAAPLPWTLSGKQREVLELIAHSRSTKEIAHALGITYKTAVSYRTRLMDQLDIHDVAGLTRYAVFHGLVRC